MVFWVLLLLLGVVLYGLLNICFWWLSCLEEPVVVVVVDDDVDVVVVLHDYEFLCANHRE